MLNMVMGTIIAWVLVRDRFPGKGILDVVIDIPFALPTIVAGLVLLSLYGPKSPLGVDVSNTRLAVFLAIAFVTLPFVVRTVQPVLEEMERDVEDAAASLGASRFTTFRRVILPTLVPAIFAGAALSFARGDQRVRLAGAAQRQPAQPHRGRLGPGARASSRAATPRRRRRSRRSCWWSRCSRSSSSTSSRGGWRAVASPTAVRQRQPGRQVGAARPGGRLPVLAGRLADRADRQARPSPTVCRASHDALTDPDVVHALQLTAQGGHRRRPDQHGLRRGHVAAAGALRVPRQAGAARR